MGAVMWMTRRVVVWSGLPSFTSGGFSHPNSLLYESRVGPQLEDQKLYGLGHWQHR